jgi:hypothetical protein
MTLTSPESVQFMFRQMAMYLRVTRQIQSSTINQYVSHCVTGLGEIGWSNAVHIRSPLLAKLLQGWFREDIEANPQRLTSSIPATADVMRVFFIVAKILFHDNPRKLAEVCACGALTYYMALRANEGAAKSVSARDDAETPDSHHLHTRHVFLRFNGSTEFFPTCVGTVYPPNQIPSSVDVIQDSTKNTLQRGSQHRGAHHNPRTDKLPFDVVDIVWAYVSAFPPPPSGAFFPSITSADLTYTMQQTAIHPDVQLDPTRLTARCLRPGSATMMRNMKNQLVQQEDLLRIRDHGQWAGNVGAHVYAHQSPDSEKILVAPSLYDSGFMSIMYLRWFYMTPK